MTLEEAIKSNPTLVNVPLNTVEAAFINRGYDKEDDYTTSNKKELELVSADLYVELATIPEFREGELFLKYNRDILMRRARSIYLKYNDPKLEETGAYKVPLKVTRKQ